MSLALSGFSTSPSPASAGLVQSAYTPANPATPAAPRTDGTTITISQTGRELAANDAALVPASQVSATTGTATEQKISAAVSEKIGNIFRGAGINVGTNAQFNVDALGNLQITGVDGLTAEKIRTQLDEHPAVVAAVHAISTFAL